MIRTSQNFRRSIISIGIATVIALVFCILWLESFRWATSPFGKIKPLSMFTICVISFSVVSIGTFFLGFLFLISSKYRYIGVILIVSSIIFLSLEWIFGQIVGSVRDARFSEFTKRAQPVVDAIELYEKRNGFPPSSLNDLVPNYLSYIPPTGMGGFPAFYYSNGKDLYHKNGWLLAVHVGVIPFDWQALEYRPGYEYSKSAPRYGKWVLATND